MKKGISLIVLVITIIVMIILAASVVITLSNTGVIDRASQAVDLTNESQVQDLAVLIWADAYIDGKRGTILETEVTTKLSEQGVTSDKWNITISDTGVSVKNKNANTPQPGTLGYLIKDANDYGKTVDYSANGINNWRVFYHTNEYVYLISPSVLTSDKVPTNIPGTTVYGQEICWQSEADVPGMAGTIQHPTAWMLLLSEYASTTKKKWTSYLLDETYYTNYRDSRYDDYIVGVVGAPTVELYAASWNAKRNITNDFETYNAELIVTKVDDKGCVINGGVYTSTSVIDDLYTPGLAGSTNFYWLASPAESGEWEFHMISYAMAGYHGPSMCKVTNTSAGLRPVVCLKASIPASRGTTTDFSLVK